MMRAAGRGLELLHDSVYEVAETTATASTTSAEKLGIEVHTMGDGFTWDTKNPEQDRQTARETWALCVEKMRSKDYDLLVFDELVYVLSYEMLPTEEVLAEFAQRARRAARAAHRRHGPRRARRAHRSRRPRHRDARDQASLQRRHPRPAGNRILRMKAEG